MPRDIQLAHKYSGGFQIRDIVFEQSGGGGEVRVAAGFFKQPNLSVKINFSFEQCGNNLKAVKDGAKAKEFVRKSFYQKPRGEADCICASKGLP